jgi:hypothetical protein
MIRRFFAALQCFSRPDPLIHCNISNYKKKRSAAEVGTKFAYIYMNKKRGGAGGNPKGRRGAGTGNGGYRQPIGSNRPPALPGTFGPKTNHTQEVLL